MAKAVKKSEVKTAPKAEDSAEQVRMAAYYNWERTTGGNPVDEETTRQFWLEAEQQVSQTDC